MYATAMRLALIVAAGVALAVPTPAQWVEAVYSRQLYIALQNFVTPLSSRPGFALFDLLLAAVLAGLSCWWIVGLWRARRRWLGAGRLAVDTVALAAGAYLVFLLLWGLNYRREPLQSNLDFRPERVTGVALAEAGRTAVARLNDLHGAAHRARWPDLVELPERLGPAFGAVQRQLGIPHTAVPGVPKATLLTPYFRRAGFDGMINPFSLEVLVNGDVLPFERPHVVAHEWAHLAGYANEAEASFVGWLTCLAGEAQAQYSAWIFVAPHLWRHLPDADRRGMWERLDAGPTADFRAAARRHARAAPQLQRHAGRVYDGYLRANRVASGLASYGEVVDLVLGSTLGATALAGR